VTKYINADEMAANESEAFRHKAICIDDYDKDDCFMFAQLEPDMWYPVKKYWKKLKTFNERKGEKI
jgi:hypothetical protein